MRVSTALAVSVALVDAVDYVAPLLSSYKKGYKSHHSSIGKVLYQVTPVALLWHTGSVRENALQY